MTDTIDKDEGNILYTGYATRGLLEGAKIGEVFQHFRDMVVTDPIAIDRLPVQELGLGVAQLTLLLLRARIILGEKERIPLSVKFGDGLDTPLTGYMTLSDVLDELEDILADYGNIPVVAKNIDRKILVQMLCENAEENLSPDDGLKYTVTIWQDDQIQVTTPNGQDAYFKWDKKGVCCMEWPVLSKGRANWEARFSSGTLALMDALFNMTGHGDNDYFFRALNIHPADLFIASTAVMHMGEDGPFQVCIQLRGHRDTPSMCVQVTGETEWVCFVIRGNQLRKPCVNDTNAEEVARMEKVLSYLHDAAAKRGIENWLFVPENPA